MTTHRGTSPQQPLFGPRAVAADVPYVSSLLVFLRSCCPGQRSASAQTPPLSLKGRKDAWTMRAYRTESPYYFSSKRLLSRGALVFYSEKIRRYVHPQDGILFDQHPRLHLLSEEESQELETRWQKALSHYQ